MIFNGNRWTHQIDALTLPFRETFSAIFFVSLGLQFEPGLISGEPRIAAALAAVLLLKTIAAAIALRLTGLNLKTSVGMEVSMAHVGEFAVVLSLTGLASDVIRLDDYRSLVAVAVGSLIR